MLVLVAPSSFLGVLREIIFTDSVRPRRNRSFMKKMILLSFAMLTGCVHDEPSRVVASDFQSRRIERELNFYVATHPSHATNHFYVGATRVNHGQLIEAFIYWKEERILLPYTELEVDASHDAFAWQGHELKLGRDTVDTPEDIAGSTYLQTHRQWAEWVEQCIAKGRAYTVMVTDARRAFPTESTIQR
jgi:hypothetical protein